MRSVLRAVSILIAAVATAAGAQTTSTLAPTPKTVTMRQLNAIESFDGQLVQLTALVRHTDTPQLFTLAEKQGREIHVVVPHPATDATHVGDSVAVIGFVRRFSGSDFERDYSWFRRADYPDLKGGDWVILATSVRTPEGTELVPSGVISNTPPNAKPVRP